MDSTKAAAVRRLLRDWKQIEEEPLPTVSAVPEENNIFLWHCNLRPSSGIYRGIVFHLKLNFPHNYPHDPPSIYLLTLIPHPNVFSNSFVCLNILRPADYGSYSGWSSAYTVQSILLQLQSFLFAENIPQDYGSDQKQVSSLAMVIETKKRIEKITCPCGHSFQEPFPPLPKQDVSQGIAEAVNLPPPVSSAKNLMNPLDKDDGLVIDQQQLSISSRNRGAWLGVRSVFGYHIMPSANSGVYYEVVIGRTGTGASRVGFSVGLNESSRTAGNDNYSWGYGGTGKKAHGGTFTDYGTGYLTHDVIGVYLELKSGRIFFFKNGACLGNAFTIPENFHGLGHEIYPTVCVRQSEIRVNFGRRGFMFAPQWSANGIQPENQFFPNLYEDKKIPNKKPRTPKKPGRNYLSGIPVELLIKILDKFSPRDLLLCNKVCKRLASVISTYSLLERQNLICFHSKISYDEAILGIGVKVEFGPKNSIKEIHTPLDYLSYDSFSNGNLREGVWKEKFHHFLPLIINPGHAKRAESTLLSSLQYFDSHLDSPSLVLKVLPKLMNTMVVSLMKEESEKKKYFVEQRVSERALLGYCSFHHMLLHFAFKYPILRTRIEEKVDAFLASEEGRSKKAIPDMGEFLALLSISSKSWQAIGQKVVREIFDRNVLWNAKKKPILARPARADQAKTRLNDVWEASIVSHRLLMFQVYFLKHVARPEGKTIEDVLDRYNKSYGRPNNAMKVNLHNACNTLIKINSWPMFFDFIHLPRPTPQHLFELLNEAIANSERRHYTST